MKQIGLILFPGSNCERETALAIRRAGMQPIEFLWNESLDKLKSYDGYVLIGGFSYEDRSRAGIIAALDPVLKEIKKQSELGKPVLGICNGAQILLESGLVPGIKDVESKIALTENKRLLDGKILGTGFYNTWGHIKLADGYQKNNAFTRHLTSTHTIHLPIAHAQGRFIMDADCLQAIKQQGLAVFQYCDEQGQISNQFPINPNGSVDNIAAIMNPQGNVMAIMPHPERTAEGDPIFHAMRDYIDQELTSNSRGMTVGSRGSKLKATTLDPAVMPREFEGEGHHICLVRLIITDNQALSVQKTLQQLGMPVIVNRFIHWEIQCDNPKALDIIKKSGVLYCDRKEQEVTIQSLSNPSDYCCLVRSKENLMGTQALQVLQKHHGLHEVTAMKQSILWQFKCTTGDIHSYMNDILLTNIIGNRYAHELYRYAC